MPKVYTALVHYPVTDKHGDVVSTSVTDMDIHDIARASRTFGICGYYIVTPVEAQHWLVNRIIRHWNEGWGATYNPNRRDALSTIQVTKDLGEVNDAIIADAGEAPYWVATSARKNPNTVSYSSMRERLRGTDERPYCFLFGTGWGLHQEVMMESDFILEPIHGTGSYNHLSVRSAASIIFDRLFSPDDCRKTEQEKRSKP